MHNTSQTKRLLDAKAIRAEYGLGRNSIYLILDTLPVVRVGRRKLILRADLEQFLSEVARNGEDIIAVLQSKKAAS